MKDNDLPSRIHQTFFPGEILHSKELSSASVASPIIDGGHHSIIICHKDRKSFYTSTRKVCRTAKRIWSAFSNTADKDGEVFDTCGYFVGEKQPVPSSSSVDTQNAENAAIHKRLSSEFGPSSALTIDVPNTNVTVNEYSLSCLSKDRSQYEGMNVIFFDLDTIDSTTETLQDGSDPKPHHDIMQKVLSVLLPEISIKGKKSIVHVRSETMHRIVTSMSSAASNNGAGQKPYCASGVELEKYLLSKQNEREVMDKTTSSSNVIRRLRQTKSAANCPLTIYPSRFVELPSCSSSSDGKSAKIVRTIEICRFHNYDAERGCLRSKKAQQNSEVKGCDMDHDHCHRCGGKHRAFECPNVNTSEEDDAHLPSVVFRETADGSIISVPFHDHNSIPHASRDIKSSLPALLVLGGRLRGRTLATCEMLPLSSSSSNNNDEQRWMTLPNLSEHRGSHAACSPVGSGLVFVLGGGTADGNSDTVEILDFGSKQQLQSTAMNDENGVNSEWRWNTMAGKLSSPRHAFGAVSCMANKQIFSVGGWKYGSISCESMERLTFEFPNSEDPSKHRVDSLHNHAQWELCAPLLLPRRLHSVAASTDGSSIYVFGGFIDERRTTPSIERYNIDADKWSAPDELPYGGGNCPLVQAVADQNGFLIFPYSTEQIKEGEAPSVLRYTPGSDTPFSPALVPNNNLQQHLRLPIANWHSFSAISSRSLRKAFLVGGTIKGKWTDRSFVLDLDTMEWKELPAMTFARRRLAICVLE